MVTNWHFLIPTCFLTSVAFAVISAVDSRLGLRGPVLAFFIGSFVGFCFAGVMWIYVKGYAIYTTRNPQFSLKWLIVPLYLAALPWIFLAGISSERLTKILLSLVF